MKARGAVTDFAWNREEVDPFGPPSPAPPPLPPQGEPQEPASRLPALYRADPGSFLPLARAILETLGRAAAGIRCAAAALERMPAGPRISREGAGTSGALRRFLSAGGARPAIWACVAVRPSGEGDLEVVPCAHPSAVIAWPAEDRPIPLAEIPADLIPAGISVQAVHLAGPSPIPAIAGDRFRGEVLG